MGIDLEFGDAGKKIVGKCDGLPLAISVLGGILKGKSSSSKWEEVIDSHLSKKIESIENVLALSYDDLPYKLKPCFLYMGILQENQEIEARELYRLWIAEGIVSGEEESMMDVAEGFLKELAYRSMVQVQIDNVSRRIKSCKLHDLMRKLCLEKGKEEGFLQSFDLDVNRGISSFSNTNTLKLAVFSSNDLRKQPLSLKQIAKQSLRALYFVNIELHGRLKFKSCRALILCKCEYDESKLSKDISKMVHLRYLSLSKFSLSKLPSSVGELQFLETLDLRTDSVIYIPNNIFLNMKRLKHLYLFNFDCGGSKKLRLNGLRKLETLEGFDNGECWNKDISELVNLRYFSACLCLDDLSLIIDQINNLEKTKWVEIKMMALELSQADIEKMFMCRNLSDLQLWTVHIGKLPNYNAQLWPNLVRLSLSETKLDEDGMEFLKKLPKLRELELLINSFIGKEIICAATDFCQLMSLTLSCLDLEKWRVDGAAFPNLFSLVIRGCENLEILPEDGFSCLITKLKELKIDGMPPEFIQKYEMLSGQQIHLGY